MNRGTKKLALSKETLRTLDDQDLTDVVGGHRSPQTGVVCVLVGQSVICQGVNLDSTVCQSGICNSVACQSVAICGPL